MRHLRRRPPRAAANGSVPATSDVRATGMNRLSSSIAVVVAVLLAAATGFAQAPQPPSSYYPAPPPERAPTIEQGASTSGLSSPLPANAPKVERTEIAS